MKNSLFFTAGLRLEGLQIILHERLLLIEKSFENPTSPKAAFHTAEDIQLTRFYMSCVRALEAEQINRDTLKKFFDDIELPFFDEPVEHERDVFSILMNANLKFGFTNIFRLEFSPS